MASRFGNANDCFALVSFGALQCLKEVCHLIFIRSFVVMVLLFATSYL